MAHVVLEAMNLMTMQAFNVNEWGTRYAQYTSDAGAGVLQLGAGYVQLPPD